MEGVNLAIHRVGIYMKRVEFHGVGMQIECVFLRKIHGNRIFCGNGIARFLIVIAVAACELVLLNVVCIDHMAVPLTDTPFAVVIQTVGRHVLPFVRYGRPLKELRLVSLCVEKPLCGMYHALSGGNNRRTIYSGGRFPCVVIQGICLHNVFRAFQMHVVFKHCLLCGGVIFAPIGSKHGFLVY